MEGRSGDGAVPHRGRKRPLRRLCRAVRAAPAAETISKFIIVDMYAKAVQGMAPEDAVKWAHGELVKIYA